MPGTHAGSPRSHLTCSAEPCHSAMRHATPVEMEAWQFRRNSTLLERAVDKIRSLFAGMHDLLVGWLIFKTGRSHQMRRDTAKILVHHFKPAGELLKKEALECLLLRMGPHLALRLRLRKDAARGDSLRLLRREMTHHGFQANCPKKIVNRLLHGK